MKGGGNLKGGGDDSPMLWTNGAAAAKPSHRSLLSRYNIFFFFISLITCLYTVNFLFSPTCPATDSTADPVAVSKGILLNTTTIIHTSLLPPPPPPPPPAPSPAATTINHIVFGIAASARFWHTRKDYIKLWWRPRHMRGFVWIDKPVKEPRASAASLPTIKISSDTSKFPYTHRKGSRSAIRISRIVSETFRLSLPNVRWFVMGDDDTVFIADNLVRVLSKFDHRQPYYIGSLSESHLQNIYFSYGMAYGGGGFAISRPLAAALADIQDECINRYPALYGSDDRIQACMAELGVPLTRHSGFHQFDVYGDLLGLLAAHPVVPLVTLHHLDVVKPVFPDIKSKAVALRRLFDGPVKLDSAAVAQQSICYDGDRRWTVSVSWGFVVQVVRGVMSPREMETPARTFLNWYKRADYTGWSFNTRPVARNPCQRPFVYYLASSRYDRGLRTTVTEYRLHREEWPACRWDMLVPSAVVDRIVVYKKPDPGLWDRVNHGEDRGAHACHSGGPGRRQCSSQSHFRENSEGSPKKGQRERRRRESKNSEKTMDKKVGRPRMKQLSQSKFSSYINRRLKTKPRGWRSLLSDRGASMPSRLAEKRSN